MNLKNKKLKEELLKEKKRIRDRNYRFKKLSADKQRVSIAKDVIKQLNTKKFIPNRGDYLLMELPLDYDENLQSILLDKNSCKVCALGALFSSCVLKTNNFTLHESDIIDTKIDLGQYRIIDSLKLYFSIKQLHMIENTFELHNVNEDTNYNLYLKCIEFGKKFLDSKERMIAIMQNIINNNGTFVP